MPNDIFFPELQGRSLSHVQTLAHRKALTCTHAPVVSHNTQKLACIVTHNHTPCLPESQTRFPQTILHCFLQSTNWLYPDPAHRPESETIKNSIYTPAVSTWAPTACDYTNHQLSSSVCDFKLQAAFHIYLNMTWFESVAGWAKRKLFLIAQIKCRLLNTYLIRKILAFMAVCC